MNLKKVFSGCLALLLILVVSACGANGVNGSGKVTELDEKEVKEFKTGFLYVKSAMSSAAESDKRNLEAIESVAKEQNVDFYIFDEKKHQKYIQDLGVNQYSEQLAFYQDGKQEDVLDFEDISKDDVLSEVKKFIEDVHD